MALSTWSGAALIVALYLMMQQHTKAQQQQQPQVYVIQDTEQQQRSSELPKSWNNQKLTTLQQRASGRSAKQLLGHEEPHYHSYKHMGFGSWPSDRYYQPLQQGNLLQPELPYLAAPAPLLAAAAAGAGKTSTSRQKPAAGRKSPSSRRGQQPAAAPPAAAAVDSFGSSPMRPNATQRASTKRKNLVCYYGTWAVYRPDAGKFAVENIDPFLCTHIIYGFTGLSYDNQIKPLDPWNDLEDNYGKGAMRRFTNLKRVNPDLKTLVAIGGWNEGSIKYSKMASEPESRAKFVASVLEFLKKYNFDGLDLDWEYPGSRGGYSYDKQNFVRLLRELHQAFEPEGYLLTAAVSAGKWFVDPAYDIGQVSKYLDLINLMAYDYHGGWESKTGMNAPLFHSPVHDTMGDDALLNVNWSVNYWLQQGASREKIMLGVGSYGRSFTLDKASVNGINAPASQKGQAGPYTREPGSLGYNELCESFERSPSSWTIVRDPDYLAPYAYNDRQWVGYDDRESLALKAQYAKSMGLGGIMMWSIETDDFQGRCHDGEKFPLLNTVRRVMDASTGTPPVAVLPKPTTTPTRPQPAPASSTRRPSRPTPTQPAVTTPGREIEDEPVQQGSSSSTTTSTTVKPPTTARVVPGSTRKPSTTSPPSASMRPTRPTTSKPTTSTTTVAPTGTTGGSEFMCRADGMFADPKNCRKFIRCVSSGNGYSMYRFDCGPGTAFNEGQQYCDHIYNVPSCSNLKQQSTTTAALTFVQPALLPQSRRTLIRQQVAPVVAAPMLVFG